MVPGSERSATLESLIMVRKINGIGQSTVWQRLLRCRLANGMRIEIVQSIEKTAHDVLSIIWNHRTISCTIFHKNLDSRN